MLKVFNQWRTRTITKDDTPVNARGAKTRSVSSASAAREHMQRALEQTARPSQAAGASPHYAVPRAPNPNNPTRSPIDHAAIRAAAQRIELTKTQSLSDVKNMLNTAFNAA